jgi:hypothetical protein
MNFSRLNPENFKKWIKNQSDFEGKIEQKEIVGQRVETRLRPSRMAKHAVVEEGKPNKVIKEFAENGGVVKEVNEDEYTIEVNCGSLVIDRRYVIF